MVSSTIGLQSLTLRAPALLASLLCAAASLGGCYNPTIPSGAQKCTVDGKCPEGLTCFPDKRCYKPGSNPTCMPVCSGQAPLCDKMTLKCVQCLAEKDCPVGNVCVAQVCKPGCSAGHPSCVPDAGTCDVDLGACRGCLSDAECSDMSKPRCDKPTGLCVPCLPSDDQCPTGKYCDGKDGRYACVDGCASNEQCAKVAQSGGDPKAITCCGNRCVDVTQDAAHCGKCGTACSNGMSCCNATCVDRASDVTNCGGCGTVCTPKNVDAPACAMSACGYGKCNMGFGDCDSNAGNGCETPTANDVKNCGSCGSPCMMVPNAQVTCVAGNCAIGGCTMGYADCNRQAGDGCEVAIVNDIKNCGACGVVCPVPMNAQAACAMGKCGIGPCAANYFNCNANPADGCEVNLTNDAMNCGVCGRVCVPGANQNASCVANMCRNVCKQGFGDCDVNPANGCEVDLSRDPLHCSACGMRCNLPNAVAGCAANLCTVVSCNMGFGNCNALAPDGCEVNFTNDAKNCGKCAMACPANAPVCVAGVCTGSFKSCKAILDAGAAMGDGVYTIDPDGVGPNPSFKVYCEMTTDGGGWEVQAFIRKPLQWDWLFYTDNGVVGDVANGFSSSATLRTANDSFNEKIVIYLNLVENNISLGKQWHIVRRADNVAIPYNTLDVNATGWAFRDSFGKTDVSAGNICTHGCDKYRGHGMFHDNTGISWAGTQGGDYGCRDGNNICWGHRGLGCNVGAGRCAYLINNGEGVIYAVRTK